MGNSSIPSLQTFETRRFKDLSICVLLALVKAVGTAGALVEGTGAGALVEGTGAGALAEASKDEAC